MRRRDAGVLTPREQEVIQLLASGLTNEEIARQLGISLDGVKYHVSGIFRRLRVANRYEAAALHLGTGGSVLTPREQEVIELVSAGLSNEEIARQLEISLEGVKYHVSQILRRLGADNRHEAVTLRLRAESKGRLAAAAPIVLLRKLPFGWLAKAATAGALTAAAAGIALFLWSALPISIDATTPQGCSINENAATAPDCAAREPQAATGAGAISAISADGSGTCALKDGGVWCWGEGDPASTVPIPVPDLASGVTAISDGCAVKDRGVWCWPDPTGRTSPRAVALAGLTRGVNAISGNCALREGGVWCWDYDGTTPPVARMIPGLAQEVSAISMGEHHGCAVMAGGVWCWGANAYGQLGNGSTADSLVPVAVTGLANGVSAVSVGRDHSCALKSGGVWCWGHNGAGQLGDDGARTVGFRLDQWVESHVPVAVSGLTSGVSEISAGSAHTCALKDSGAWCWGANSNGRLGNGGTADSVVPVAVSGLTSGVTAISAGFEHSCAVQDGRAACWGRNASGQLGTNRPTGSEAPVAVSGLADGVTAISTGADHTCALRGDAVWCWGRNGGGQLGNGGTTDNAAPVAPLGLAGGVTAISTGPAYSCALKQDSLWCWGRDFASGLGDDAGTNSPVPVEVSRQVEGVSAISGSCAVKDGGVSCWVDGGATVVVPGLESGVSALIGKCAVKDGGVWCWRADAATGASNVRRVPGLESGASGVSADALFGSVCALKDGGVWCSLFTSPAADYPAAAVVPGLGSGVSALSGMCALKDGGDWCWNLTMTDDPTAPFATARAYSAVSGLESGVSALSGSCAVKDGGAWCWGGNSNGQLGNNSPADSPVPVAVQFPASSAGPTSDPQPIPSHTSTNSGGHGTAYVLAGSAVAALAIIAAGVWAVRRRRPHIDDDMNMWRNPGA